MNSPGTLERAQLSFGQQRLWLLDRLEPGRALYNIPHLVRLRGRLDVPALERALAAVLQRHESLRTTIEAAAGEPWLRVVDEPVFELPVTDLAHLGTSGQEEEISRLSTAEARRVFDLETDLPLRARLFRLGESAHALMLVLHHIAADGWSMSVLYRELGALYGAFKAGAQDPLDELPVQYADFAGWQREYLSGSLLKGMLEYWKKNLAGAPALLELPCDHPRPPVQSYRGAVVGRRLSPALGAAARELGQRRQATLFMTLFAAFNVLLHRYTNRGDLTVGTFVAGRSQPETEALIGFFVNTLVLRTDLSGDPTFFELLDRVRAAAVGAYDHQELPFERLVEELQPERSLSHGPVCQVVFTLQNMPVAPLRMEGVEADVTPIYTGTAKFDLAVWVEEGKAGLEVSAEYSTDIFEAPTIERLLGHFEVILQAAVDNPRERISRLPMLSTGERTRLVQEWNDTACDFPRDICLHECFEEQARRTPSAGAVVFEDRSLSYRELDERASRLAARLRLLGAGPDVLVGICVERSLEMMVGLLGILKSGAAYVPLDPAYPAARIAFMLEDSRASVVLTQTRLRSSLPETQAKVICLDEPELEETIPAGAETRPVKSGDLAYVIYTSGSSGHPKGVMITHRNAVNFLAGMDRVLGRDPGVWMAVTSISFDISVLELFWTLSRGFKVVILSSDARIASPREVTAPAKPALDFSLFYFADDSERHPGEKYRLLLEGAAFADKNGFRAIWTPERHFHSFGGLYPNPSVIGAALSQVTQRIQIRAGSVVAPLHNPLRIAEEWSVVDHLSKGRVGISFASGWHDRDFVLAPGNYEKRSEVMKREIELVRQLWRGEEVEVPGVGGKPVTVRIHPKPLQAQLPVWLTAAGNPKTFEAAGQMGACVLTHLLGQSVDELAGKIEIYRAASRKHGHGEGSVTLAVHAFVGEDDAAVRAKARGPFCQYLLRSMDLLQGLAHSLYPGVEIGKLSAEDREILVQHAFDHHFSQSALLGSPERVRGLLDRLARIGVDEVACLIDFGVDTESAMAGLPHLARLQEEYRRTVSSVPRGFSFTEQLVRHGVTHLQCTPSHARLLAEAPGVLQGLKPLRKLLLGGEALPATLARQLADAVGGEVINMYGPTETTVWSAAYPFATSSSATGTVPIGRPLANTRLYILDKQLQPLPEGVPGELLIGGEGLARGYLRRPELTAERFVDSPFERGERLYRTGDLARYRTGGTIEFLGRIDQQVKLRGHRIEPGEIEAALARHPSVAASVVVVREDVPGDPRLVAYVAPSPGRTPEAAELRESLKRDLPEHMVPSAYVVLDRLPLTPNGKIDRRALPPPGSSAKQVGSAAPVSDLESSIAAIWCRRLGIAAIGRDDNVFELGGHSLLVVQVQAQLHAELGVELPVVKLFQYPTVATLAAHLAGGAASRGPSGNIRRRASRQRAVFASRANASPEVAA